MHGGGFEVGKIDGNLREIARFQRHAHGFYVAQTAGREADGFGDFIGYADIRSVEVHVLGDQEFARSDDRRARCGMQFWFANVGLTVEIALQVFAEAFELAASHVFKIYAIRSCGSGLVEKYRDAVTLPYFIANPPGERDTVVECDAFDGDEGNDIGRANSRMSALVDRKIDEFSGLAYSE